MNFAAQSEQTRAQNAKLKQAYIDQCLSLNRPLLNQSRVEGFLTSQEKQRFTANNTPIIRFSLLHFGLQALQQRREVVCHVKVLAIGQNLCQQICGLADGSLIQVAGFLTKNAYKDELSWVVLEAETIVVLEAK